VVNQPATGPPGTWDALGTLPGAYWCVWEGAWMSTTLGTAYTSDAVVILKNCRSSAEGALGLCGLAGCAGFEV